MSGIQEASMQSIRPYKSSEQYLYAMKEDLAEWLTELYGLEVDAGSFLAVLETGSVLCHHANNITQVARDFSREYPNLAHKVHLPTCGVTCNESAQPGTFQARDNVSNFIQWCRKEMDIKEVLMFETEDLVLRKNEKHFVLCLLEVARRASRFGMSAPILIQMEEEIEEEIREDLNLPLEETPLPRPQKQPCNFKNLDQMVQHLVSRCTCPVQFSMIKVSEGKYRVGNSSTLIFVRILRNHVMVRVGGGWDTLEHYLDKHDPCRCTSLSHKQAMRTTSLQRTQAAQVQHEITARLTPRVDSPNKPQPALIVSRSQSPLPPVEWRTYTAHKALSTSPPNSRGSLKKTPGVQMSWDHSEPRRVPLARVRERSATPSRRLPGPEEKSASKPSAQSGKETLQDPFCYQQKGSTNSYASKALPEPPRRRETQRIQTAELQKEKAKSLPPSVTEVPRDHSCQPPRNAHQEVKIRPSSPSKHFGPPPTQQASKTQVGSSSELEEGAAGSPALRKAPLTKRSPSPVKQAHQLPKEESSPRTSEKARPTFSRPPTPSRSYQRRVCFRNGDHAMPKDLLCVEPATKDVAGSEIERGNVVRWETFTGQFPDSSRDRICRRDSRQKIKDTRTLLKEEEAPKDPCGDCEGDHRHPKEKGRVYTPLPIDLAEEKALYQTLEEEILANIKELEADSCGNHQLKENEVKEYRIECGLRKDTLAFGCNGPRLSTHTLSCLPSAKALGYGEGVPRSGVYVPHHNAKWPPVGFYYDSVIQELSRTLRRERVETEKNSPQLSSPLLNGDQAERMVLERVTIHTEKFVATESEGNRPNTHEGQVEVNRNGRVSEHEVTSDKTHGSPESVLENSKPPQNRPRRTLKKPERVPSIYKLKLRPKMRPRRDNRPDRRPSKIPKPVAYRHAQRASSAKAQAKSHSSKCLTQNSLTHTRQNSTGNGGSVEEVPPSQCSPSSTYSRDSGTKRATPKEKTGLTDDEESWV